MDSKKSTAISTEMKPPRAFKSASEHFSGSPPRLLARSTEINQKPEPATF
jgi:hypothetical protein